MPFPNILYLLSLGIFVFDGMISIYPAFLTSAAHLTSKAYIRCTTLTFLSWIALWLAEPLLFILSPSFPLVNILICSIFFITAFFAWQAGWKLWRTPFFHKAKMDFGNMWILGIGSFAVLMTLQYWVRFSLS